jgi:hypothetical protein
LEGKCLRVGINQYQRKKALTEAQERLNARCEQIKSQVFEIKVQVKSTAKNIVDETKAKGGAALYRGTEFVGIKKRLLNVRTAVFRLYENYCKKMMQHDIIGLTKAA